MSIRKYCTDLLLLPEIQALFADRVNYHMESLSLSFHILLSDVQNDSRDNDAVHYESGLQKQRHRHPLHAFLYSILLPHVHLFHEAGGAGRGGPGGGGAWTSGLKSQNGVLKSKLYSLANASRTALV